MKIWCETCDGTGELDNSTMYQQDTKKCLECEGKGYVEDIIFCYYAELGKAVKIAYDNGAFLVYDVVADHNQNIINYNFDMELEDLLEWAEGRE